MTPVRLGMMLAITSDSDRLFDGVSPFVIAIRIGSCRSDCSCDCPNPIRRSGPAAILSIKSTSLLIYFTFDWFVFRLL